MTATGADVVALFQMSELSGVVARNDAHSAVDGRYSHIKLGVPGSQAMKTAARFRSKKQASLVIPHYPALELQQATVALVFRARKLEGAQGLFAKRGSYPKAGDFTLYLNGPIITLEVYLKTLRMVSAL